MLIKMDKLLLLLKHLILECNKNLIYLFEEKKSQLKYSFSFSPNFSFQKCIPEDESTDIISGASTTENPILSTNFTEIPTRRILRRHDKNPHHEHSQRNGLNDEYINHQISSTSKTHTLSKPYLERVNNYAETRARIFNETADLSNILLTNKNIKTNQKQHSNFIRPSYRKQQQQQQQHQNSSHQHRSYTYQHSQQTTNNHMQQYPTGKTIDPSSHVLNTPTNRSKYLLSAILNENELD
jgi:hypothetical protein